VRTAIVDYGMGNLFSVDRACRHVGLDSFITSRASEVASADAVILPGVGAFGDAMDALRRLDLVGPLRDAAAADRPFMGICLGLQMLLSESQEFGTHRGLDIVPGEVVRFDGPREGDRALKVPQVGWNQVVPTKNAGWLETPLASLTPGEFMYFVHSFYVKPANLNEVLAVTSYGQIEFCSALRRGNLFACQFHPERSGPAGLAIYRGFAEAVLPSSMEEKRA
jgi:glutamine amidotransferase